MTPARSSLVLAVLILVASTFLAAACGGGRDETSPGTTASGQVIEPEGASDGLTVTFDSEPNPPAKGANTFIVTVAQSDGSPVTDATVRTVFSMPAMPSMNMPAMRNEATLEHAGGGRYRGTGHLEMGGTWNVAVTLGRGSAELGTRRLSIVARE